MLGRKQVGIFSSPIYTTQDLAKLGYVRLLRNFDLSGIHILGAITPRSLLQYQAVNSGLDIVVTQTLTTGRKLVQEYGIRQVGTIPPAIDPIWYDSTELLQQEENLCDKNQFIIGYIGPPDVLRGLPRLLSAFANLRSQRRDLKLLILNRKSGQPNDKKTEYIHNQIERLELKKSVELVDGILSPMQLVELCRRADLIALPFEIIPSEAPLSILELRALGKPLVTSQLGCIPELSPGLFAYFAEPGDQHSLENKLWAAIQEVERSSRKEIAQSIPNARRSWEEFGLEWSRLIEA
jgi:glycosyltransferase involved in cell wall biosynthesis